MMSEVYGQKKLVTFGTVMAVLFLLIFAVNHWMSMELKEAVVEPQKGVASGTFQDSTVVFGVPSPAGISGPDPLAPVRKSDADLLPPSGNSDSNKEETIRIYELSTPSTILVQ